jgi:putative intracellular protease/amidase
MSRIAIVVSTVGYHWQELFDAYEVFERAGEDISLYTVDGSPPRPDPLSIKRTGPAALLGIGVPARIAPHTARGAALRERLLEVAPVASLDPARCDALYLPGGHGCLFDVNQSPVLHRKIADLYARKALLSAVCHATSTFALTTIGGRSIVTGHELTGFPHPLDQTLIRLGLVHEDFLPLPLINDDVLRAGGASVSKLDVLAATLDPRTVRVSLPFITGVGPKAAARTARLVLSTMAQGRARPVGAHSV